MSTWHKWLAPVLAVISIGVLLGQNQASFRAEGGEASFPPPIPHPADNPANPDVRELGRMLFYEPGLSRDSTVSCATCHQQALAFTDGRPRALGIADTPVRRNTMALSNLAWAEFLFWDGRVSTLEELVVHPLTDPLEMGQDTTSLLERLQKSPRYAGWLSRAFGEENWHMEHVEKAMAQFLRNLTSFDSEIDRRLRSLPNLEEDAVVARALFPDFSPRVVSSILLCIKCHDPQFHGANLKIRHNGLKGSKEDRGLGEVTGLRADRGKFKAPTFRNIALTAPYMHDGRFASLEEVVRHYNSGIRQNRHLDSLLMPDGKPLRLHLTEEEVGQMVDFLHMFTDSSYLTNPEFGSPF